jgi:septum formation protein
MDSAGQDRSRDLKLVLASESQFRRRALDMLGLAYEVRPSRIDEKSIRDADPAGLTRKLAEAKAWKVAAEVPDAVVVSGDAVVAKNDRIYEKPQDHAEAARFLRDLSGSEFRFVTALAVLGCTSEKMLTAVEVSQIRFRRLLDREIDDYIRKYDVLKFAGAFEGDGVLRFAEQISGSYNFIFALPVSRLIVFLRDQGVQV